MMNLINAVLATEPTLPPILACYEYVVAGNGLFIRAADTRMEAMVQISDSRLIGLCEVEPYAKLLIDPIPVVWLKSILESARRHMPKEVLYQFVHDAQPRKWRCVRPTQAINSVSVRFEDEAAAVVDLHSHNSMAAFFSGTDDGDEQGLRFYCVIGKLDTDAPAIACRVGVYGHHMSVPVETIFESAGLQTLSLHVSTHVQQPEAARGYLHQRKANQYYRRLYHGNYILGTLSRPTLNY